jgi:hypothetical protein
LGGEGSYRDSHAIILLDCWSVHQSTAFLNDFHLKDYPKFHPLFIPAGCTGKAQPADLIMQRPLKHGVADEFSKWMAAEVTKLLREGATPALVKVETGLVRMTPLLVKWLMISWLKLKEKKELLKKGWLMAGFDKVFDKEFQATALLKQARGELKGNESVEDEPESTADEEETDWNEIDEKEENDDDLVEMTVEEALLAAVEQRPAAGMRRSARLASSAAARQERSVLALLQDEEIEEGMRL